jgi:hypothetical protein
MAALMVINGRATLALDMNNDDLRRLMKDATPLLWAGEGFWATSAANHSTGPIALWVPPGSIIQFQFDPGDTWDPTSLESATDRFSMENDDTVIKSSNRA